MRKGYNKLEECIEKTKCVAWDGVMENDTMAS
jgi:hypothetical protein